MLSVAGVVVVGVLVELLLTDSHMSKFVRAIYGFFVLFVIVSPLPNLIRSGAEFGNFETDAGLVGAINAQSLQTAQTRVDRALANANFVGVIVTIIPVKNAPSFAIERVFVNTGGHQSRAEIIGIVTTVLNIDERSVTYV